MTSLSALAAIREEHDALYGRWRDEHAAGAIEDEAARQRWSAAVDALVAKLEAVETNGLSLSEYNWLCGALLRWQGVIGASLRIPRYIKMPPPPMNARLDQSKIWTQEEIKGWLDQKSYFLAKVRKALDLVEQLEAAARVPISGEADDWIQAKIHFANEVLDGRIELRQLTASAYPHLQLVWLEDVKSLVAYFNWKNRGAPVFSDPETDHQSACQWFHDRLRFQKKHSPEDFAEARSFLEATYLRNGRVDWEKSGTMTLREGKAERLSAFGLSDPRGKARAYVEAFYENILPAVSTRNPQSVAILVDLLEARWQIVDCLEAALAIYGLDRDAVELAQRALGA